MPEESTKMGCPNCGSTNWEALSDVHDGKRHFGLFKACCDNLIMGSVGLLCGFCGKKRVETTTMYVCKNCGTKFKQLVPVKKEN